jgi:hypothetical protein
MRTLSKVLVAVAVGALAAPALAGAAQTPSTHGVVVQRDAKAGVVVVATKSGKLLRVNVAKPGKIAMGTVLKVVGTKVTVMGRAHKAKLRGVVVRRHRHSFALAGNGSVLAVTSPTPPAPGQQVTTTVQVTPTALDDDDGDDQVLGQQVASLELRGTVVSQTATTLMLAVTNFADGLSIAIGNVVVPTLQPMTPVEVRVALTPVAGDPAHVGLTLVSLRVEDNQNDEHEHADRVKAEGTVIALTEAAGPGFDPGSITIQGEHGTVTFVIPADFGPTGVTVGSEVEARGTPAATADGQPTLTSLETKSDNSGPGKGGGDDGDDDGGHSGHGSGGDD